MLHARLMKTSFTAGCTIFVLSMAGCNSGSERRLTDTEGRTFVAKCTREGDCHITQQGGPRRAGKPQQILRAAGRLVGICDVTPGGGPEGTQDCRPIRCERDQDCPPAHDLAHGQCLNRWCADAAQEVRTEDAVMLCLAGTGLGRETPRQIERFALALNCGSPCKIPAPCMQP
jgi:hypothetical protein